MKRLDRNLVARAVELAVLVYVIIAARAWLAVIVLALLLIVVALAAALTATRVRLREVTVHDTAQYLTIQQAGLGTGFQAGEGDQTARSKVGRRP